MTIDIDRLHEVLQTTPSEKNYGAGKSTAMLYLLMGEVELGDPGNTYLIIAYNRAWANQLVKMFKKILYKENLTDLVADPDYRLPDTNKIELVDGKQFIFIEAGAISHLRGYHVDDVYFDLGPHSWREYLSLEDKKMISTVLVNGRTLNDNSNFTKR